MKNKNEKWKVIKNYKNIKNNYYEISSFGRIREKESKKILSISFDTKRYYHVSLRSNEKGKRITAKLHQLVFVHFGNKNDVYTYIHQDKNLYCINHKDGVKTNNHISNLELSTYKMNNIHAVNMNLTKKGEKSPKAKDWITNKKVEKICKLIENKASYNTIIKKLNLPDNKSTRYILIDIKRHKSWKHISSKYNF